MGQQARRTGTSSPLGLLLDHGVDALNVTLSSLNLMALLQIGDSWALCMALWTAGALPFFFSNWEEFYTGTLCALFCVTLVEVSSSSPDHFANYRVTYHT